MSTVTVQVRLLKFGDVWKGESVTGLAYSAYPAGYMDVTLHNAATNTDRTVALPPEALYAVTRSP